MIINDNIRYLQLTELPDFIKAEHNESVSISTIQRYSNQELLKPEIVKGKKLYSENEVEKFVKEWYSLPIEERRLPLFDEAKVLAVANNKGGVGKTVSVHNISAALTRMRHKVLMIDFDPQSNLSMACGIDIYDEKTVNDVLQENCQPEEVVYKITNLLHIIPANPDLSMYERRPKQNEIDMNILGSLIRSLKTEYDFIIFDAPPQTSVVTASLILLSDHLIIPYKPEVFAYEGLLGFMEYAKDENPDINVAGIFITQLDERTNLHRVFIQKVEEEFPDLLLPTPIRANIAVSEASAVQQDIFAYKIHSHGARDYRNLAKDIVELLKEV